MLARFVIAAAIVGYVIFVEFSSKTTIIAIFVVFVIAFALWSKPLQTRYKKMEDRFLSNLNERSKSQLKKEAAVSSMKDAHMETFDVNADSPIIGKKLMELEFRTKYGINIVSIIRGEQRFNIPGGSESIYPADKIVVLGTDEQMTAFREELESHSLAPQKKEEDVVLQQFVIEDNSPLLGKPIAECSIRDKSKCLVVGVERDEDTILNPEPTFVFHEGDVVSVVGEKERVRELCCIVAD